MSENGKHWRVVIQIQEVTPATPGVPARGIGQGGTPGTERRVHETAGVNVAAASESAAFARAISALQALRPQMSGAQMAALQDESATALAGMIKPGVPR